MSGRPDSGVATVWAALAVAAVLTLAVLGLGLGGAVSARHRAEAAADLAALAAASHAGAGEAGACAQARRVINGMSGRLTACRLAGWDAFVEVSVASVIPLVARSDAVGRARAGPITR